MSKPAPLGFVGVGQIGAPIAERLLAAGHALRVHDLRSAAAGALGPGATRAASPAEVAATCSTVFACLPSLEACRNVVGGPEGLVHGGELRQFINLATIGSTCSRELAALLAAHGVAMLDAPVTGGPDRARTGRLGSMVSGPHATFLAVQDLLRAYSDSVIYLGPAAGAAQTMKAINGMVSRVNLAVACEAVAMGLKAGLRPEVVLEVLDHGTGQSDAASRKLPLAVAGRTFGAQLQIVAKDIGLWRDEADALGLPSPLGRAAEAVYAAARRAAGDEADVLAVFTHVLRDAETGLPGPQEPNPEQPASR